MADSRTIDIDGIGLVLFERSKRAKRVIISVKPFKGVRVAVPYRSSFEKAENFVLTKKSWIKKHLAKVKLYESKYNYDPDADYINKTEVKAMLTNRLNWLSSRHGISYNRVFIRNQKTRWGSCSSKNNISLNMKLVKLPEELIDYVILHELVHTIVKNHSKAFWKEMDKFVGNGKQTASRLKSYGMEIY